MFLDFFLSPITDKNTFTGGILDTVRKQHEKNMLLKSIDSAN